MSHLTESQRYTIFRMLQAGFAKKEICIATGKDKSVLCRELKRNAGKHGYSATLAQILSEERKERFSLGRRFTDSIKKHASKCLTEEQWSPEQIVGDQFCRLCRHDFRSRLQCLYSCQFPKTSVQPNY